MRIRIQWKIECLSHVGLKYKYLLSLVDPHSDSTYHPDADPDAYADSDFYFAADPEPFFYADAYPDPTFHPHADLDPDPSFHINVKPLKKCSNMLIFPGSGSTTLGRLQFFGGKLLKLHKYHCKTNPNIRSTGTSKKMPNNILKSVC
jgi:hypothetical protein